jgi:hypothetical protein
MSLPVYELKISENLQDDAEVSFVALVDSPAIKKDFLAFKDEFVEPSNGEHKTDFLPRCISYVINEGKESEQAVAICNSIWDQHFAKNKISFDYDETISTDRGKELAMKKIAEGNVVYIISARQDKEGMLSTAQEVGIPESRVYATGSNKAKVEKIKELGINKHYDNNADVIAKLGSIGEKFEETYNYFRKSKFESFAIVNEDQHIISGPLMLADELIYRNNEKFGEHYVKFSADTIKQISIKFSKKKYQNNVNLMHDNNQRVDGVTMFESFIVDRKRGIMPMSEFKDVADGSWFGSFYVENDEVWQGIKEGKYRGFSVEGMFDYEQPKSAEQNALETIEKLLNQI